MKLKIVTICLDAMPTLPALFFTFNQLNIDWTWYISEGAALNVNDTKWCQKQPPRYSEDGTHEFLQMLWEHPRVQVSGKKLWTGGKVEMINDPLTDINEECVLLQCDADEIWTAQQLTDLVGLFRVNQHLTQMRFFCRYFVGVDIVSTTPDTYGNKAGEWLRAWRFFPGDKFLTHEPPVLGRSTMVREGIMSREETRNEGLVFDHYSWAFPNQVQYKEFFYGYEDAYARWVALQANTTWPIKLKRFLPWVDDGAIAKKLSPSGA